MKTPSKIFDLEELRNRAPVFEDRAHAGVVLAGMLEKYRHSGAMILAIPSGGVPVASEIAGALKLPLLPLVASKITPSWNSEAGYGAIAFNGSVYLRKEILPHFGLTPGQIEEDTERARQKVKRRMKKFLRGKPFPDLSKKTVILVDDGIAAGVTMRAAIEAVRQAGAAEIVVASPTGQAHSLEELSRLVDAIYCANIRGWGRFAVAEAYESWSDVDEDEAVGLLTTQDADKNHVWL